MLEHHNINYKQSVLHYTRQGAESKVLLCFHGYGWNCYNFDEAMPDLIKKYTVYCFDLFAHGESKWNEKYEFTHADFKNMFTSFFEINKIGNFSLMGYSMGGRWATSILNLYPSRVESLYLIAADGLQRGTIIDLLAKIKESNSIIQYLIHHPSLFLNGIKLGYRFGFIDRRAMEFYIGKNDTEEKRQLVMTRIKLCKNLFVPKEELISTLQKYQIKVHLFYGIHDFVMPVLLTTSITKKLGKSILHKIDDDHMLIVKPPFLNALRAIL